MAAKHNWSSVRIQQFRAGSLAFLLVAIGVAGAAWATRAGHTFAQASNDRTAPGLSQQAGPVTDLVGTLTVVWQDPLDGGAVAPPPLFILTTDAGEQVRLHISEGLGWSPPLPLAAMRVHVTVAGSYDPSGASASEALSITELEPPPALPGTGSVVTGSHPWVTILCKFPDFPSVHRTHAEAEALLETSANPSLEHYWQQTSYGQFNTAGSVVAGTDWFTLPQNRADYAFPGAGNGIDLSELASDCTGLADSVVDFTQFDGVNLQFNATLDLNGACNCSWGTSSMTLNRDGVLAIRMTWMAPWADFGTYAHETGHGFGLPHSSGGYGQTYNSQWDTMSAAGGTCELNAGPPPGWGCFPPQIVAHQRLLLGLFGPSNEFIPAANSSQVIDLQESETFSGLPGRYMLARIPVVSDGFDYYTVEMRRRGGYDVNSPAGDNGAVLINEVDESRFGGGSAPGPSRVIDLENDGDPNDCYRIPCIEVGNDARWVTGEEFSDPSVPVRIKILSLGVVSGPAQVGIRYGNPVLTTASMRFSVQPSPFAVSGQTLSSQPTVEVVAADGMLNNSDNSTVVTLSLLPPATGTLTCTGGLAKTVTNGVAAFAGCTITGPDGNYSIEAQASGLPDAQSNTVSLVPVFDCGLGQCVFDFESGNDGFTPSGLWHRETLASPDVMSSPASMAYNQNCVGPGTAGCEYNTGSANQGSLTSPLLNLGDARVLSFRTLVRTDNCPDDYLSVLASSNGGATFAPLQFGVFVPNLGSLSRVGSAGGGFGWGWSWQAMDGYLCSGYGSASSFRIIVPAGTTNLKFRFQSDGSGDQQAGWFIDDVRLDPVPPLSQLFLRFDQNYYMYPPEHPVGAPLPDWQDPLVTLRTSDNMLVDTDSSTAVTLQLLQDGALSPPSAGPASSGVPGVAGAPGSAPPPGGVQFASPPPPPAQELPGIEASALPAGALTCAGGLTRVLSAGIARFEDCSINIAGTQLAYRATSSPAAAPVIGGMFTAVEPIDCDTGACSFDFEAPMWPYRESVWHREGFATISGMTGTMLAFNEGCAGPGVAGCSIRQGSWMGGVAYSPLMSSSGPATLRFKVARDVGPSVCGSEDYLQLHYSLDGFSYYFLDLGASATISPGTMYLTGAGVCGNSLTAQTVTVNLPAGVRRLVIQYYSGTVVDDPKAGVFIDDVQLFPAGKHLSFQTSPDSGAFVQHVFDTQPVVAVTDGLGVLDPTDSTTIVTLAIQGHPGALVCQSGPSRVAYLGLASFNGCYSTIPGDGLVLVATSSVTPDETSAPFDVVGVQDHELSAVSVAGEVMLCGRNPASQLWCRETIGGAWGPWTLLLESGAASRPIMVTLGADVFVFYRGQAGDLRYLRRSGGIWTDQTLGGNIAGDPAVAVDGDGDIMVVVLNSLGSVYYNRYSAGSWTGYAATDGQLSGRLELAAFEGNLHLFGLNGNAPIWTKVWNAGANSWGAWSSLGGAVSVIPVTAVHGGELYMLTYSLSGSVWYRVYAAGSWGPWTTLGGSLAGRPELAEGGGQLLLGAVNAAGGGWSLARNGSWGSWVSLGGVLRTGLEMASGTAGTYAFGLSADGGLWYRLWSGGAWGPWTSLGGVLNIE